MARPVMKNNATDERLAGRRVVLLGAGHTNAHIIRMWGMNPIPDTELVCVSDHAVATYSGMLPAVLAGQIVRDEMEIDLVRLCASAGARLVTDTVTGLDKVKQLIHFNGRPSLAFDALSVGIGSVPTTQGVRVTGDSLLKIKPMQTFLQRLSAAVDDAIKRRQSSDADAAVKGTFTPLRVVIAGSGAAGIEITFCLPAFLRSQTSTPFQLQIVTRSPEILPGVIPGLRKRAAAELSARQVEVTTGATIVRVNDDGIFLNSGKMIEADIVIWATGASPPEVLKLLDLPKTERGFLATDTTLRSTSGLPVFAVGDTGTIVSEHLPKAGVYAVRQGPVLWDNVRSLISGKDLREYTPQRNFLKLLNTGDGRAIGEWKGFSFCGRWVMQLKDRIDSKFMKMYQVSGSMGPAAAPMQCKGCGCKLGGDALDRALHGSTSSSVGTDAEPLDDAAVVETDSGQIIASTDFFTNPIDDAYLFGRIAALHSASDMVAMGATTKAALANVVLPEGNERTQQQALHDFLAGARLEFSAMGANIAGGHTIVGPRWEAGFTVIGEPPKQPLLRKQNLKTGDLLYMTKPLGVGVLLAAHMRSQCPARDYEDLMAVMLQRQHDLATVATDSGITAATDITGFGLAGHLIEMLESSQKSAKLRIDRLPLLSGAAAAFELGIESTLAPNNRSIERLMKFPQELTAIPQYKALFDPQTCGGLLLGVPVAIAGRFEAKLSNVGLPPAVCIGEVCDAVPDKHVLEIVR